MTEKKKFADELSKGRVHYKKCEYCKQDFTSKQYNTRFCSKKCIWLNMKLTRPKKGKQLYLRRRFRKLCIRCGMFFLPEGRERTCLGCKKPNVINKL